MRRHRIVGLSVVVFLGWILGGCGGDEVNSSPPMTQADDPASAATQDAAACRALGDVLTIKENADLGTSEGRMEAQEQKGWYDLAARVLQYLPPSGSPDLTKSIAELKSIAGAAPAGSYSTNGIGSPAWDTALATVADTCTAVGAELTINVFTGG